MSESENVMQGFLEFAAELETALKDTGNVVRGMTGRGDMKIFPLEKFAPDGSLSVGLSVRDMFGGEAALVLDEMGARSLRALLDQIIKED